MAEAHDKQATQKRQGVHNDVRLNKNLVIKDSSVKLKLKTKIMGIWTIVWWVLVAGIVLIPLGSWFYKKVLKSKDSIDKYKQSRKK